MPEAVESIEHELTGPWYIHDIMILHAPAEQILLRNRVANSRSHAETDFQNFSEAFEDFDLNFRRASVLVESHPRI